QVSYPFGAQALGRISYDAGGRMSAQLMRPDRANSPLEAYQGYAAYFGTYDVDETAHTVIHHVEASLFPGWIGTNLKRAFEFSGNRLILTAVSREDTLTLVWERLE
ncbi:MAG: lipocalin-like domain-containing protein, partial [Candidatus Solibacter usitatus]|nr:lipocalin-like domain-containing protein [Candidatus Solibacter usitatus]